LASEKIRCKRRAEKSARRGFASFRLEMGPKIALSPFARPWLARRFEALLPWRFGEVGQKCRAAPWIRRMFARPEARMRGSTAPRNAA
jgi:hypothetical protein